ncbi:hypothetical protein Q75_07080 [Bacillus coahuilensis p1.1.43]|uniref:N-acetyltransferase domain-containing protein n=1 Tax=Bacillus coahuilensis p1.1.43 TaxID=1150625 RepID=A0A147K915_9BACI|nr:GNAT family protein [Bacillus coahuilensis]KUP06841.1 hypothetical protein Q75_07080 [Bacillus coahuilensis p1.1.43]
MKEFPQLETSRLLLRELKAEDKRVLFTNFTNERLLQYFGMEPFQTIEQAKQFIDQAKIGFENEKMIRWAIVIKENNRCIGTCGIHNWVQKYNRCEIGYEIAEEHWRKGYATEAISAIQEHLFTQYNINRIGAIVYVQNTASINLLEKLGFENEGILRQYMKQHGKFHDTVMLSLLNPTK